LFFNFNNTRKANKEKIKQWPVEKLKNFVASYNFFLWLIRNLALDDASIKSDGKKMLRSPWEPPPSLLTLSHPMGSTRWNDFGDPLANLPRRYSTPPCRGCNRAAPAVTVRSFSSTHPSASAVGVHQPPGRIESRAFTVALVLEHQ
jgi:hypothetical protein